MHLNYDHFANCLTSEAKVQEFLQKSFYIKLSERIDSKTDSHEDHSIRIESFLCNLMTSLLSGLPRRFYGKIKVRVAPEKMVKRLARLNNPDFRLEFLSLIHDIDSLEQAQFCFYQVKSLSCGLALSKEIVG